MPDAESAKTETSDLTDERFEHFQEKWIPVFRPEMRQNKELERFRDSKKSGNTLERREPDLRVGESG